MQKTQRLDVQSYGSGVAYLSLPNNLFSRCPAPSDFSALNPENEFPPAAALCVIPAPAAKASPTVFPPPESWGGTSLGAVILEDATGPDTTAGGFLTRSIGASSSSSRPTEDPSPRMIPEGEHHPGRCSSSDDDRHLPVVLGLAYSDRCCSTTPVTTLHDILVEETTRNDAVRFRGGVTIALAISSTSALSSIPSESRGPARSLLQRGSRGVVCVLWSAFFRCFWRRGPKSKKATESMSVRSCSGGAAVLTTTKAFLFGSFHLLSGSCCRRRALDSSSRSTVSCIHDTHTVDRDEEQESTPAGAQRHEESQQPNGPAAVLFVVPLAPGSAFVSTLSQYVFETLEVPREEEHLFAGEQGDMFCVPEKVSSVSAVSCLHTAQTHF